MIALLRLLMNSFALLRFRLLHMPPDAEVRSTRGPHQRHKREHQNGVQDLDQHCSTGYQKENAKPFRERRLVANGASRFGQRAAVHTDRSSLTSSLAITSRTSLFLPC